MSENNGEFKIQAYAMWHMQTLYKVSYRTWKEWMKKVPDLGEYNGKKYTPAQVEKIINHIGKP